MHTSFTTAFSIIGDCAYFIHKNHREFVINQSQGGNTERLWFPSAAAIPGDGGDVSVTLETIVPG